MSAFVSIRNLKKNIWLNKSISKLYDCISFGIYLTLRSDWLFKSFPDVGGFFEAGTLVRYNLVPEVVAAASSLDEKSIIHNLPVETNLTREDLTFSFSTSTSPSLLVYVSSKTQDYMAVALRHNGKNHFLIWNRFQWTDIFCPLSLIYYCMLTSSH